MNVLSLFDGMSCGQIALERANIKVNKYYASKRNKMNYWISGDYHLNHANILKYSKRVIFMNKEEKDIVENGTIYDIKKLKISKESLYKHNEGIIRNHNTRVKEDDIFIHNGDFCFKNGIKGKEGEGTPITSKYWENRLNGKIIFTKGNHDSSNSTKTIIRGILVHYYNHDIYIVHKPIHYNPNYAINFTAHVHDKWSVKLPGEIIYNQEGNPIVLQSTLVNVGIDVNKYMPINFKEALGKIKKRKRGKK